MTWTKVGTDDYRGGGTTSGQGSWVYTAGTVGDLRVIQFLTLSSVHVSSISGGGVTTWHRAGSVNTVSSADFGIASTAETWYGKITSTGTALTITYSGSVGSTSCRAMKRDYRSPRGLVNIIAAGAGFSQTSNQTSTSPLTWPSLTTTNAGQLLVGVMGNDGTGSAYAGSTSGFTYTQDSDGNWYNYALAPANNTAYAPQMTFTGQDGWYVMETLFDDGGTVVTATAGLASASATGYSDAASGSKAAALAFVSAAAKAAVAYVTGLASKASTTAAALAAVAWIGPQAGTAEVGASAFDASYLAAGKPERRRYTVPAEPRVITVPAEARKCTVPAESRSITVLPETSGS